ncbi:uncharacterized protein LOC123557769 [Mercenaria mercenaria]|uniref:uncharacterized protein LOC123557769 n=1 Tax=Mercenaria mercenaria TaxID=6596 RepID=UPI00234ED10A|nr:uncharacterized protein LOC123557769 [Mercenaria mercenaria]XP_053400100.1 uncharacterized protein LOC123557769 [Mercenaria mercenaria]XP_053400101.1 uncharacterized protein LOC123557769 [Mercenaria mercenaria]XP_053400102.1 uncharacterized protein LOC123557769 [Mercenaria mercenaria]
MTTDNLGNTVLHRCVGKGGSSSDNMLEIYKLLIKNSINVNCRNVFGHSAGALLYMDDVCKVLLQGKFDFTAPDRWGRIPLINVMNQNARPIVLETMLQTHPFTVNLRDIYESTPLHYAAYSGTEEYVEVLLKHGADLNAKDALGDFPIDTAFRHGKQACWKLLAKHMHLKTLNEKIFLHEARHVTLNLSSLYKVPMNDLLDGFPKNMDTFAADALKNKYKRGILHDVDAEIIEVKNIVASVREHVHEICEIVRGYDSRFRMSVFPTGSSAEGTKVGPPDEFDFALCIENLSANCVIETSAEIDGYACLKFKDSPISGDYIAFSDSDRYFLALPFLHYLFRYIRRALSERRLWEKSNLHRRHEDKFRVTSRKPVFNYDLYWTGAVFKHLQISIDLVPTVYQSGWWPSHFRFDRMKLMNEKVKAAGCFILMQTEENSFDQGWHQMNDSISLTCNLSYEQNRNRLLQISVAPAEITLIQSLPEVYRQAYALAKIVKSEALCPNVQIDIRPVGIKLNSKVSYRTHRNHSLFFPAIKPSAIMKSYWLKNCLFYVADEIQTQCTSLDKSYLQITILVYQKLLDFAASWNFQPYILQSSELFELARGNSYFEVFISRMIICINVVLAILGQQFPKENDVKTLLDTCRKNRAVLELKRLTY